MQLTWSQIIIATCAQLLNYIGDAIVAVIDCFAYSVYVYVPESSINNSHSTEINGEIKELHTTGLD